MVVDFGSGGGFDVFIAAQKIGIKGRAIGVDANQVVNILFRDASVCEVTENSGVQEMLALARRNASRHSYTNVSFIESDITSTPLEEGIADCVISNCVINLVHHSRKHLVFKEMFRLLREGGRIAVSDMLALKELPDAIRSDIAAYVGCIAGAAQVSQYEEWLHEAGFTGKSLLVEVKGSSHLVKKSCLSIPSKTPICTRSSAIKHTPQTRLQDAVKALRQRSKKPQA